MERFPGGRRREHRRPALATEVNPVARLSSTLWAEHDLASRLGFIPNVPYVPLGTKVPYSIPSPHLTGLTGFLPGGRKNLCPGIQFWGRISLTILNELKTNRFGTS
jgi:hypothetical protein